MIIGSIATQNNINVVLIASAMNDEHPSSPLKKVFFKNKKILDPIRNDFIFSRK